jgi:O-antigen/teichoic acid export membrane protein
MEAAANKSTGAHMSVTEDKRAASHALRGMFSRDFIYLGVSVLQVLLAAAITPFLTRLTGVEEYGQLVLAVAAMQILGPLLSFGLPFASQKVFAGEDGNRQARGILAISAVATGVALLFVVLAAPVWSHAVGIDHALDACLAAGWAACFALSWTALAMLRSQDRLGMTAVVGGLQSLGAQILGVTLLYVWSPTTTSYLCGAIIGQAAAGLVGLCALRPDWSALRAIREHTSAFRFGLPMVPQQLAVFILFAGDRIVIHHYRGSGETGRYSVAYNVGSLAVLLLVLVNQVWVPRIYAVADRGERSHLLATSRNAMNLILIPVVFGLVVAAPVVLRIWAPSSFDPGSLTLIVAVVAMATFPYGQFLANGRALMSEGMTGRAAVMTFVGATVNVGLCIVLVPPYGITGAAIATVISYGLLALLTRPPSKLGLEVPATPLRLAVLIGAVGALSLATAALPTSDVWLGLRLAACAGAVICFVVLVRRVVSNPAAFGKFVTPADPQTPAQAPQAPSSSELEGIAPASSVPPTDETGTKRAFLETALYLESGDESVFALHTSPAARRTDLGVVLAHSGANNFSAHRNGVWSSISRQLAREGIASLRFDFAGTGESSGEFVPKADGHPAIDLSAAMNALRARDIRRLLVVGSCFGGLPGAVASTDREDVAGLILLSPPLVLPGASGNGSLRDKIREIANRSTLRAVAMDSDYRRWFFARLATLARAKAAPLVRRSSQNGSGGAAQSVKPAPPVGMLLEAELARLVADGRYLEVVYGSHDENLGRVERSSAATRATGLMRREPNFVWTVLEGPVHGLEDTVVQEELIRLVVGRAVALSEVELLAPQT